MNYALSPDVPFMITTVTRENRKEYLDMLRSISANRIWLCGYDDLLFCDDPESRRQILEHFKACMTYFSDNGLEVGAWIRVLGFGTPTREVDKRFPWTRLRSVVGWQPEIDAYCPEDPGFRAAYLRMVEDVAACHPDLIMLDDDLCLSVRPGVGCFCDRHLRLLSERLGEDISPDWLADRLFTGGPNPARDAWLACSAQTLTDLCTAVRETAHRVDPHIRLGFCAGYTSWDMEGIDALSLTKVLAGEHQPYLRFTGAPYWCNRHMPRFAGQKLNAVIECTREQIAWCRSDDTEVFAENDSYPRPATQVPASLLEGLSFAMAAEGVKELKYLFDYHSSPAYETLYLRMHRRHMEMYDRIAQAFDGLCDAGVRLYRPMRTLRDAVLPAPFMGEYRLMRRFFSGAAAMLTQVCVPVCYTGRQAVGAAFGQDAAAVPTDELPEKLILDLPAALILQDRGIDVGLRSMTYTATPDVEVFSTRRDPGETVLVSYPCLALGEPLSERVFASAELAAHAAVESTFGYADSQIPASYRYTSGGVEFLVFLFDATLLGQSCSIENSYCRQRQIVDFIGNRYPVIEGHPELYCLYKCSADGQRAAVLFENLGDDPLMDAHIAWGQTPSAYRLYGAEGIPSADRTGLDLLTEPAHGEALLMTFEVDSDR